MNIPSQNACNCILKELTTKAAFSARLECTFPVLGHYIIHVSRWQVSIMQCFCAKRFLSTSCIQYKSLLSTILNLKYFQIMFVKFQLVRDVLKPYFACKTCKSASQKCLLHCMAKLTSKTWNDLEEFRMTYKMEEEGLISEDNSPIIFRILD